MAQPGKGQGPGPAAQAMPLKSDPSKEEEELEQALKHLKLLHIKVPTDLPRIVSSKHLRSPQEK